MGNCFSADTPPSSRVQGTGPRGQRLGSANPPTSSSAAKPKPLTQPAKPSQPKGFQGSGKTLGGSGLPATSTSPPPEDPRTAAARAAELRNQGKSATGGKLSAKLEEERRKGKNKLLQESAMAKRNEQEPLIYD